jgi:hypothetical protein
LELRPVRNTQLLEIRCFSDSPKEAAEIANAIAGRYRAYHQQQLDDYLHEHQAPAANPAAFSPVHTLVQVEIVDQAVPPLRPSRPNKPLNIVTGGAIGFGLGLLAAAMTTLVSALKSRWAPSQSSRGGSTNAAASALAQPDRFWRWFAVVVLALIAVPIAIAILGMLAAIAIPNFVKARQRALANHQQQLAFQSTTNSAPASAETWAPEEAPESARDLQKILDEAKKLTATGHYEEALQHYLWHHNHAQELGDSYQNIVRMTSALSDWEQLGRRYPKAKQALVEMRDKNTKEIAEGRGDAEMFQEVRAINHELHDDDATYALFKTTRENDPKLAEQCYSDLEDLLVAKGEYQWCLSRLGDPQRRFDSIRQFFEMEQGRLSRLRSLPSRSARFPTNGATPSAPGAAPKLMPLTPADMLASLKKLAEDRFVGQTRQLIEILVGTKHNPEAETIRNQALDILDDPRLRSAVDDAEKKVRN